MPLGHTTMTSTKHLIDYITGLVRGRVFRVFAATALCTIGAAPAETADLVLVNGKVYTVSADNAIAEAVAVRGGRIFAVGGNAEIRRLAGPETRTIDLSGKTVIPGLIDAHGHIPGLAQSLATLDLVGTSSYEKIIEKVAEWARSLKAGEWVIGRGWDQNDWPEKAFPHHAALSAVTKDNPVFLSRVDGHACFVNAKALELAGVTSSTRDPDGGRTIRDKEGNPTGVFIDAAQGLVSRLVPEASGDTRKKQLLAAAGECLALGLTSVHDAGVSSGDIELYKQLIESGEWKLRVYAMLRGADGASLDKYFASGPLIGYGGDRLTVRSIKCMADGALGSRGAALLDDYSDEPGNRGLMVMEFDRLESIAQRALEKGFQVCTHAIGDRGNHVTLDAYEAALKAVPGARDPRFRIEHAQIVAVDDIPRFAVLQVIPSMQATHATSDMYWAEDRVGPERIKGAYAWRRFMDAGCRMANGSDFPVENANPLWGLYAAITRQDRAGWPEGGWHPEERMTREEALRSFTIDAAYAAFQEDLMGSIWPGKLADLVVLDKDIMTIDPTEILQTRVTMTIIGGVVVYEASAD